MVQSSNDIKVIPPYVRLGRKKTKTTRKYKNILSNKGLQTKIFSSLKKLRSIKISYKPNTSNSTNQKKILYIHPCLFWHIKNFYQFLMYFSRNTFCIYVCVCVSNQITDYQHSVAFFTY